MSCRPAKRSLSSPAAEQPVRECRFFKALLLGALFTMSIQIMIQASTLMLSEDAKGGLINIQLLLIEGLKTPSVLKAMIFYITLVLLLSITFSFITLLCTCLVKRFLVKNEKMWKIFVLLLMLFYAALIVINIYNFPATLIDVPIINYSEATDNMLPLYLSYVVIVFICSTALMELICLVMYKRKLFFSALFIMTVALFIFIAGTEPFSDYEDSEFIGKFKGTSDKPHIILIGLDSLRFDIVEDETLRQRYLPNIERFLSEPQTTWFDNAWTPLARTFGAWFSLLSGRYPKNSDVRYNLQHLSVEQKMSTVVPKLVEQGYYTIYGSDEKRFSNIDETYGFQDTFGPPPGVADWIMSYLEDSPLHNQLRHFSIAKFLLPYTYSNRASSSVYNGDIFPLEVKDALADAPGDKPIFLAVHLCVLHWPYKSNISADDSHDSIVRNYLDMSTVLDQQFKDLTLILQSFGLTDNSVIVVFSDHGEGLVTHNQSPDSTLRRDFVELLGDKPFDRFGLHGTDLLTPIQNKVLLAVRDSTRQKLMLSGKSSSLSSLVDISPTIARYAGIELSDIDGYDLTELYVKPSAERFVFMETGFTLKSMRSIGIDIPMIVEEGAEFYFVEPFGYLTVKPECHERIVKAKQVGVTDGEYIVAAERLNAEGTTEILFSGLKLDKPYSTFEISENSSSETLELKTKLMNFYADDFQ